MLSQHQHQQQQQGSIEMHLHGHAHAHVHGRDGSASPTCLGAAVAPHHAAVAATSPGGKAGGLMIGAGLGNGVLSLASSAPSSSAANAEVALLHKRAVQVLQPMQLEVYRNNNAHGGGRGVPAVQMPVLPLHAAGMGRASGLPPVLSAIPTALHAGGVHGGAWHKPGQGQGYHTLVGMAGYGHMAHAHAGVGVLRAG